MNVQLYGNGTLFDSVFGNVAYFLRYSPKSKKSTFPLVLQIAFWPIVKKDKTNM